MVDEWKLVARWAFVKLKATHAKLQLLSGPGLGQFKTKASYKQVGSRVGLIFTSSHWKVWTGAGG